MRGGYQVIDLSKDPFVSGTAQTVAGSFFKATQGNNRKPILLSGVTLKASSLADGVKYNDEFVTFLGNSSSVSTTLADGSTVAVSSADAVTITLGN
jgi:hypothetical protein